MGRSTPQSAPAVAEAKRFIGALLVNGEVLCKVDRKTLLEKRRQLLGRRKKGMSEESFLKGLGKIGMSKRRVREGKTLKYLWCMLCVHTPGTCTSGKGKEDSDDTKDDEDESGDESESNQEKESDNEESDMDESDNEDESDDESESNEDECGEEMEGDPREDKRQMYSAKAYKRLYARYLKLKKKVLLTPASLFGPDGGYSPGVTTALQILRGCGLGAEKTGVVLSDILQALLGTRGKGNVGISKQTVKRTDAYAGPMSTGRFLAALRVSGGSRVQMCSDTSSGARKQQGLKFSQVSLSARNPNSKTGRVLQAVADSSVGHGSKAKDKADQLKAVQDLAVQHGFETPKLCVVDHESTAFASCHEAGVQPSGCTSHKWKHTIESVIIEGAIEKALQTLHTACCPSSTNPTTNTGIKMISSLFASNGGSIPKAFKLQRQVGTKYGWLSESCANVLNNREQLIKAVERKELYIPDSNALDVLLSYDTLPSLVTATICHTWFRATLRLLKGDKDGEGELPVLQARALFPITRAWIVKLTRVQTKFPDWLGEGLKNPTGFYQARCFFDKTAATLLRESAKKMLITFDRFVEKDADLTPEKAKDLPHSNDFIEGAHATASILVDRLPHCNPARIASLTQRKHNQAALRALKVPLVPSPNTHTTYKKSSKIEPMEDVMRRVHRTAMTQQMRTQLGKRSVDEVHCEATKSGIPLDRDGKKRRKADLIEDIIDANYSPPEPSDSVCKQLSF